MTKKHKKLNDHGCKGFKRKANEFTQLFLDFTALRGSRSIATARSYRKAIEYFYWFLSEIRQQNDILLATKEDFITLRSFMMECKYAPRAQHFIFAVLNRFYGWLVLEGKVKEKCIPKLSAVSNKRLVMNDYFVPRPEDIFKLRGSRRPSVEEAAAIEVMVSSGVRVGVLLQLTAADFRFNEDSIPYDIELRTRSPYCGGSILIRPDILVTKSRGYVTYISKLAARLVKELMAMHGIPMGSQIPIFPFDRERFKSRVMELGEFLFKGMVLSDFDSMNMMRNVGTNGDINGNKNHVREYGATQLDVDSLPVSEELKTRIRRQQEAAKDLKEEFGAVSSISNAEAEVLQEHYGKNVHLGPHALRRFFTCISYYRNYHGERCNRERLRDMLGHADIHMTQVYLSQLELVANDQIWKRIMLGKGSDWLGLRIKKTQKTRKQLGY